MARKGKLGQKKIEGEVERPVRFRKYDYLFLIVCEDEVTEPTYFRQFAAQLPEETIHVETYGAGKDPLGVTTTAIEQKAILEERAKRDVDYVWVVFDVDDAAISQARLDRFNNAFVLAGENHFNIAWSNEVFELWLLMHLTAVPVAALSRQQIYVQLEQEIRLREGYALYTYQHGDSYIIQVIAAIGDEALAIERATALIAAHEVYTRTPINSNPGMMVHELVNELRKWIGYYNYQP